ncbi:transposase [bacterium]|nr:MAG: transposase [bacterium]
MTLIENLKAIISHNHVNAITCSMETFAFIEEILNSSFPNEKFIYTPIRVMNVTNLTEQLDVIEKIHDRAHRNAINNYEEAKRTYYWPKMKRDFQKWVNHCEICKTQKYERNPSKQLIGSTPIPTSVGESISMDLFYIDNKQYVTSVDRYSKYLTVNSIQTKLNFQEKLEEILTQTYPNCKYLITDNEAILVSNAAKLIYKKYNITQITAPVQHSTSNGQVERTHSTLIEIIRCLNKQNNTNSSEEIFNAVREYNNTIHSVTGEKPINVKQNPTGYKGITEKLKINQERMLSYHNKNRQNKKFQPGEIVYVKGNRRRKDANAYTKHVVKEDKKNTILTKKDKIIHKDSLKKNNNEK